LPFIYPAGQEWNEMHHLKIMESLGGDLEWADRFFGQHAAFFYYWILNLMFLISPKVAYNFSELIEMHAVDTYGEFVDENEELLKKLPPSPVAVRYYENEDLYLYEYENCLCLFSAIYLVNY
jgi:ubiquinol oxidase